MSNASEAEYAYWAEESQKPSEERNPFRIGVKRTRYLLRWQSMEREVTREEWIKAERSAGFRPKGVNLRTDNFTTCATGGFSGYGGVEGFIVNEWDVGHFVVKADRDTLEWVAIGPGGTRKAFQMNLQGNSLKDALEWAQEQDKLIPKQ